MKVYSEIARSRGWVVSIPVVPVAPVAPVVSVACPVCKRKMVAPTTAACSLACAVELSLTNRT